MEIKKIMITTFRTEKTLVFSEFMPFSANSFFFYHHSSHQHQSLIENMENRNKEKKSNTLHPQAKWETSRGIIKIQAYHHTW